MQRLAALLVVVALPCAAAAEPGRPLSIDWKLEAPLTGLVAAAWIGSELAKSSLAPDGCHVCHRDANGDVQVNGFDRAVRDALVGRVLDPPTWARTSDVTIFGVLPLLAVGADVLLANDGVLDRNVAIDVAIIVESVVASAAVDQAVKFAVARERPFVAFQSPFSDRLRHGTETTADDNLSFYSGHSAAALATTLSAARIIELRTGRKLGYAILVPLGVVGALMRVAADKHWGSDVLTGMALGGLAGYVIPALHAEW